MEYDKLRSLYVDSEASLIIEPDDFVITIGKKKSNSVYHVVESKRVIRENGVRSYLKVLKSDLLTCLKREQSQRVVSVTWNSRNKK